MIQKRDILKMIKAVHRHSHGRQNRRLIYPAREWGIGLLLAAVGLVVGVVYGAYTYNTYNMIEETLEEPQVKTVRYQATQVERALEIYDARQAASAALPVVVVSDAATSTGTTSDAVVPVSEEAVPLEQGGVELAS